MKQDEKKKLEQRIAELSERIISEETAIQADYKNAVQLVETKEAKMDQIDLALDINFN